MNSLKYIFPYYGNKLRLIKEITLLFPKGCDTMVEICGGSGSISLNRYWWFDKCVFNEYNEKIVNIFRLLKDRDTREQLIKCIVDIPYEKGFFDVALRNYKSDFKNVQDKLTQAIFTYTVIARSFNNEKKNWSKKPVSDSTQRNIKNRLHQSSTVLENIEIMHRDCFEMIKNSQENTRTFIVADVPYPHDTRTGSKDSYGEGFDWPDEKHEQLVKWALETSKNKIMIFSYDSEIYNTLLTDSKWRKINIKNLPSPSTSSNKKKNIKNEFVYINYTDFSGLAKFLMPI